MNYEEFKDALVSSLSDHYQESAEICIKDVVKLNDVHLDGISIVIKDKDTQIQPILYCNDLYRKLSDGFMSFEDIVSFIIDATDHKPIAPEIYDITRILSDWEMVSGMVYPMLVYTETNKELLEKLVSTPFLDLSVIYFIKQPIRNDEGASIKITHEILEKYGISVKKLHKQALSNLKKKDAMEVRSIMEILQESCCDLVQKEQLERCPMHVLSNKSKLYGAAHLLDISSLPAPFKDKSFYVIPSSIHEAILLDDATANTEDLNHMIQEVNSTNLSPDEILSTHCYFYDCTSRQLRMCA